MRFVDFKLHDGRVLSVDADQVTALVGQGDSTVVVAPGLKEAVLGSLSEVKEALAEKYFGSEERKVTQQTTTTFKPKTEEKK